MFLSIGQRGVLLPTRITNATTLLLSLFSPVIEIVAPDFLADIYLAIFAVCLSVLWQKNTRIFN